MTFKNETGNIYGKLTVIQRTTNTKFNSARWICKCKCGNLITVIGEALRNSSTRSCGCFKKEYKRNPESPIRHMYNSYKTGAKKQHRAFELTYQEFKDMVLQSCAYCGDIPTTEHSAYPKSLNLKLIFNGIDRIDNHKGYISGNVAPCCYRCNSMKSNMTEEQFKNKIIKIYYHLRGNT